MSAQQTLLDGRVQHAQQPNGHRTGIEPVLLAAAVAARPGQRVLEGGTGSGAALLCLASRCPGIAGTGIERDQAQADMARANLSANGFSALTIVTGDLTRIAIEGGYDHAMANPPWHAQAATASPDQARDGARRAGEGLFDAWIGALAAPLRHHGTLTLIVAAAAMPLCLQALPASDCGSAAVLPLWPKSGREAKLVLLRAVKRGRGPGRLLPGLVLHAHDGGYTQAADAILRGGAAIDWNP